MHIFRAAIALALILALNPAHASDFRCGRYIVKLGDTTFDVMMKCHRPQWEDESDIDVLQKTGNRTYRLVTVHRQTWLYNYGPERFMKELVFSNDALIEIKTLGYGYLDEDIGANRYVENMLYTGMSKAEARVQWGAPDHITATPDEKTYRVDSGRVVRYTIKKEKWIYNAGSNRFLKTLVFENDRLVGIESGNYGYDTSG